MTRRSKIALLMSGIIFFIVILDQITKWLIRANYSLGESTRVIEGFFHITYIRNTGAAFGFGASSSDLFRIAMFKVLPVVACLGLIAAIWIHAKKSLYNTITFTLILGGAIGNLIDRFTFDYVVDFLDFFIGIHHYPAFNVADSCITIAGGLLVYDLLILSRKKKESS